MKIHRRRPGALMAVPAVLIPLAWLAACGGDDLERAQERLQQIDARVERARETVEERRRAVDDAETALDEARKELDEAEQQLAEAREDIAKRADDALLFREIQRRLLEDDDLEDVAIAARVNERVVTLEGHVPSEALKKRAGEIAREAAGVERVVNQIAVDTGPAKE